MWALRAYRVAIKQQYEQCGGRREHIICMSIGSTAVDGVIQVKLGTTAGRCEAALVRVPSSTRSTAWQFSSYGVSMPVGLFGR